MGGFLLLLLGLTIQADYWTGMSFTPPWMQEGSSPLIPWLVVSAVLIVLLLLHFGIRNIAAKTLLGSLRKEAAKSEVKGSLIGAFLRSTKPWRSIFLRTPAGWGRRARKQLTQVIQDTDTYIQTLNDQFTNPSGTVNVAQAQQNPHETTPQAFNEQPSAPIADNQQT
jgi:hypothetical protein